MLGLFVYGLFLAASRLLVTSTLSLFLSRSTDLLGAVSQESLLYSAKGEECKRYYYEVLLVGRAWSLGSMHEVLRLPGRVFWL